MNLEGLEALLLLLYCQSATLSIWRPCCILIPALSLTLAALQDPFTPVTLGPTSPLSAWELQVPREHFFLLTHQHMQLQLQVEFVMTCPFSLAPLSPPTASCPLTSSTCQSLRRALSSVIGHSLCTHNLLFSPPCLCSACFHHQGGRYFKTPSFQKLLSRNSAYQNPSVSPTWHLQVLRYLGWALCFTCLCCCYS